MLSIEAPFILEKLNDDNLTDDEREAFDIAEQEYAQGKTIDLKDYLSQHNGAM